MRWYTHFVRRYACFMRGVVWSTSIAWHSAHRFISVYSLFVRWKLAWFWGHLIKKSNRRRCSVSLSEVISQFKSWLNMLLIWFLKLWFLLNCIKLFFQFLHQRPPLLLFICTFFKMILSNKIIRSIFSNFTLNLTNFSRMIFLPLSLII